MNWKKWIGNKVCKKLLRKFDIFYFDFEEFDFRNESLHKKEMIMKKSLIKLVKICYVWKIYMKKNKHFILWNWKLNTELKKTEKLTKKNIVFKWQSTKKLLHMKNIHLKE